MSNTFHTPKGVRYEYAEQKKATQQQLSVGCEVVQKVVQSGGRKQFLVYSDGGIVKAKQYIAEGTIIEGDER